MNSIVEIRLKFWFSTGNDGFLLLQHLILYSWAHKQWWKLNWNSLHAFNVSRKCEWQTHTQTHKMFAWWTLSEYTLLDATELLLRHTHTHKHKHAHFSFMFPSHVWLLSHNIYTLATTNVLALNATFELPSQKHTHMIYRLMKMIKCMKSFTRCAHHRHLHNVLNVIKCQRSE